MFENEFGFKMFENEFGSVDHYIIHDNTKNLPLKYIILIISVQNTRIGVKVISKLAENRYLPCTSRKRKRYARLRY
jgi:hypothetical protein